MQTIPAEFQPWPQLKQSFFSNPEEDACGCRSELRPFTMSFVCNTSYPMQLPFRWTGETITMLDSNEINRAI